MGRKRDFLAQVKGLRLVIANIFFTIFITLLKGYNSVRKIINLQNLCSISKIIFILLCSYINFFTFLKYFFNLKNYNIKRNLIFNNKFLFLLF